MKRFYILAILFFGIYGFLNAQSDAPFVKNGDSFTFIPASKKDYRPQIGLSLIRGSQKNLGLKELNHLGSNMIASTHGLEMSLQCPLMCTKKNYVRQQLIAVYSHGDILNSLAIEINPHYRLNVTPTFEIAAGPGFGVNFAKIKASNHFHQKILRNGENIVYKGLDSKAAVFTYGFGASLAAHLGKFIIGFETRFFLSTKGTFEIFTAESSLTNLGDDNPFISGDVDYDASTNTFSLTDNLNNIRTVFKLGYKF